MMQKSEISAQNRKRYKEIRKQNNKDTRDEFAKDTRQLGHARPRNARRLER